MEEFIPGREIQVAILGKKKLGAIELKPKRKFYDYKAKYSSKAKTKHIIPVNIKTCLLYTSPSPRDKRQSRMPSSA